MAAAWLEEAAAGFAEERALRMPGGSVTQGVHLKTTQERVFASGDELGGLTRSFAAMTAQVADAREQVQRGIHQLEGARTRLQTILDTLTAGVVVFDREGRIDTVNPGATRILPERWEGARTAGERNHEPEERERAPHPGVTAEPASPRPHACLEYHEAAPAQRRGEDDGERLGTTSASSAGCSATSSSTAPT